MGEAEISGVEIVYSRQNSQKNNCKYFFVQIIKPSIFAVPKRWEHSSAGSEHLPYKQRVTGSNPVAPTK